MDADCSSTVYQNTRFRHVCIPKAVQQTLHLGIVVGKTQDPLVSAEWLSKLEETMYPSDEAVGRYIALHYPHIKVTVFRPKLFEFNKLPRKLAGCDVIHVLESEQFLGQHEYKHYKKLFKALLPLNSRLRPSLETMQFIMSKVDYLDILRTHAIPHVPTFIIRRPARVADLQQTMRDMAAWLRGLDPLPEALITKPSHSGSKAHFRCWTVADLINSGELVAKFVDALRFLLIPLGKPYIIVQPFLQGLADLEYRLYFINRRFVSCVSTEWWKRKNGEDALRRDGVSAGAVLSQLRPIAQQAVDLLPADSVLYRVDMFFHDGKCAINEIEMVDADLMPDYHLEADICDLLGDALAAMGKDLTPTALAAPSLPVIDPAPRPQGTGRDWKALEHTLRRELADATAAETQSLAALVPQVFSRRVMRQLRAQWGLQKPAKEPGGLALAIAQALQSEDGERRASLSAAKRAKRPPLPPAGAAPPSR